MPMWWLGVNLWTIISTEKMASGSLLVQAKEWLIPSGVLVKSMYKVSIFRALQVHSISISKKDHKHKTRTEAQARSWMSLSWFFNKEVDS